MNFRVFASPLSVRLGVLMHSTGDLIERSRRGDDEAFRLIFERYAQPVTGFIFGMVSERGLAEEAAQETFVRAYGKLATLREPEKFSTWLFGIARNVAREAIQARRDANRRGVSEDAAAAVSDKEPLPDERLLQKELHRAVEQALGTLDPDKRAVFTLRVFQLRSYEEIAEITGFSLSKVKSDIHRARAEMRRLIRPYREMGDAV
jgi:RNA polymerase sigma-70 factor, ECF subfamily